MPPPPKKNVRTTFSPFQIPLTFLNQQHSQVKRIKQKGARADRGVIKHLRVSVLKLKFRGKGMFFLLDVHAIPKKFPCSTKLPPSRSSIISTTAYRCFIKRKIPAQDCQISTQDPLIKGVAGADRQLSTGTDLTLLYMYRSPSASTLPRSPLSIPITPPP